MQVIQLWEHLTQPGRLVGRVAIGAWARPSNNMSLMEGQKVPRDRRVAEPQWVHQKDAAAPRKPPKQGWSSAGAWGAGPHSRWNYIEQPDDAKNCNVGRTPWDLAAVRTGCDSGKGYTVISEVWPSVQDPNLKGYTLWCECPRPKASQQSEAPQKSPEDTVDQNQLLEEWEVDGTGE